MVTNFPLKQVLQKLDALGRLMKWTEELSGFDIVYRLKASIKGQALEDLIAEFSDAPA